MKSWIFSIITRLQCHMILQKSFKYFYGKQDTLFFYLIKYKNSIYLFLKKMYKCKSLYYHF